MGNKQYFITAADTMSFTYHSFLPDERHSILNSIDSIRNLPEIILTKSFLVGIKCAVICSGQLQIIAADTTENTNNR